MGDQRAHLVGAVQAMRKKFRRGSSYWGFAYNASIFGAVLLSALAALMLQVPDEPSTKFATVATALAALFTTTSSVGNFQGKWRADRDAFYALDELLLDIEDPKTTEDVIRRRLKRILRTQHSAWGRGVFDAVEPDRSRTRVAPEGEPQVQAGDHS